jgi:hypothetical protein
MSPGRAEARIGRIWSCAAAEKLGAVALAGDVPLRLISLAGHDRLSRVPSPTLFAASSISSFTW